MLAQRIYRVTYSDLSNMTYNYDMLAYSSDYRKTDRHVNRHNSSDRQSIT